MARMNEYDTMYSLYLLLPLEPIKYFRIESWTSETRAISTALVCDLFGHGISRYCTFVIPGFRLETTSKTNVSSQEVAQQSRLASKGVAEGYQHCISIRSPRSHQQISQIRYRSLVSSQDDFEDKCIPPEVVQKSHLIAAKAVTVEIVFFVTTEAGSQRRADKKKLSRKSFLKMYKLIKVSTPLCTNERCKRQCLLTAESLFVQAVLRL